MMMPWPTTWGMLEVGMYLRGSDGSVWRVDHKREHTLRITNAQGQWADVTREPDDPVTLMTPTMEDAELVVASAMTVTGLQRRVLRMEQIATASDTKWARASLASHLLNLHHVSISPTAHVENGDLRGLLELHALSHARPEPDWIPHIHVTEQEL